VNEIEWLQRKYEMNDYDAKAGRPYYKQFKLIERKDAYSTKKKYSPSPGYWVNYWKEVFDSIPEDNNVARYNCLVNMVRSIMKKIKLDHCE